MWSELRGRGEARRPACGSDSVSPERPSRVPRGGAAFPCSSVHDTAVTRIQAHVHATPSLIHIYTDTFYVAVHARLAHLHICRTVERCAYVHEVGARVPPSTHLFLRSRDTPISRDERRPRQFDDARVYQDHRVITSHRQLRAKSPPFGGTSSRTWMLNTT